MDGVGVRRDIDLGGELRKWRRLRNVSLRELGKTLHCDHSRVWKIENNRLPLTHEVAELCDTALETGGALVAAVADAQEVIKPAQLPAAPARLVGRDDELALLTAGTRVRPHGTPTVVAIDGPAGVGKTALALRWAHDIADEYRDGQLYADLRAFAPDGIRAAVSVEGILEEFLTALGVHAVPATTEQRARLFRSLTANRRLLVVLDNVASMEEIAPLLPASPGCGVVVTSRRALARLAGQLGATRVTLRPLAESDAVDLVRSLIGAARTDAEFAAVTALVRRCGHLPLALHAAADQIAVYPHRPVVGLVDEQMISAGGTVYLLADSSRLHRVKPLLSLFAAEMFYAAEGVALRSRHRRLTQPFIGVIDELRYGITVPNLPYIASAQRKYGIGYVYGVQTSSQEDAVYGPDAPALRAAAGVSITGGIDIDSARELSDRAGTTPVVTPTRGTHTDDGHRARYSEQLHHQETLTTADQQRLRDGQAVVAARGLSPFLATVPSFRDNRALRRAINREADTVTRQVAGARNRHNILGRGRSHANHVDAGFTKPTGGTS